MHEVGNKDVLLENQLSKIPFLLSGIFYISGSKLRRKIINIKLAPVSNYFQLKEPTPSRLLYHVTEMKQILMCLLEVDFQASVGHPWLSLLIGTLG